MLRSVVASLHVKAGRRSSCASCMMKHIGSLCPLNGWLDGKDGSGDSHLRCCGIVASEVNRGLIGDLLQADPKREFTCSLRDPFRPAMFLRPDSSQREGTIMDYHTALRMF